MKRFEMKVEMDNAAFESDRGRVELGRILKEVQRQLQTLADEVSVRDINGNTVGRWVIKEFPDAG